MRGVTRYFVTSDILTNFEISPDIFIPVTSIIPLFPLLILIALIRRIVIYPVHSSVLANYSRGGCLHGFHQAILTLTMQLSC